MQFDPEIHHRRSIRLRGYDYSQEGAYYVTICAEQRLCLFGEIVNDKMMNNAAGEMLAENWLMLPDRFPNVDLDEWVIMPNHLHGIIVIEKNEAEQSARLGDIIGAWKSLTTNAYIQGVKSMGWPRFPKRLWQRNFYEHIIRNERDLDAIREYIILNPERWPDDKENPNA